MLDALVTEARLRFGLDPAAGLQVIATERLIATPLEASRPVLLVPLAMLRPGAGDADPDTAAVVPLPGRHGPRGATPLQVLARAYPTDHPVGRFGTTDSLVDRRARRRRTWSRPSTCVPWRQRRPSPDPGRCPRSARGSARPTAARGTRSRRTPRSASTCSRRPTRSTTRSRRAPHRRWPASSATCCSRSCSMPSWPPRPACSTWPTCRPPSARRSSAAIPTCSATRRRGPRPT